MINPSLIQAEALKPGDKLAVVSLSSGILGEASCAHQRKLAEKRASEFGLELVYMPHALKGLDVLNAHPELRAEDLKTAFFDPEIKGILAAIGGKDGFRLFPYLLEDEAFIKKVHANPKIFSGFSDTTAHHLLLQSLGLQTFYGPNVLNDLAELADEMLPFTKQAFSLFFEAGSKPLIYKPQYWYEERRDFSEQSLGTERVRHDETLGFHCLKGEPRIGGKLWGGCLDSLYDAYAGEFFPEKPALYKRYRLLPEPKELEGYLIFLETSEEKIVPERFQTYLQCLEEEGLFRHARGVLLGKPQDMVYFDEYNEVLMEHFYKHKLTVHINLPFGHAYPRTILAYGARLEVNTVHSTLRYLSPLLSERKR